MSKVSIDHDRK